MKGTTKDLNYQPLENTILPCERPDTTDRITAVYDDLQKRFPVKYIVDLGCNNGAFMIEGLKRGYHVIGADYYPPAVYIARLQCQAIARDRSQVFYQNIGTAQGIASIVQKTTHEPTAVLYLCILHHLNPEEKPKVVKTLLASANIVYLELLDARTEDLALVQHTIQKYFNNVRDKSVSMDLIMNTEYKGKVCRSLYCIDSRDSDNHQTWVALHDNGDIFKYTHWRDWFVKQNLLIYDEKTYHMESWKSINLLYRYLENISLYLRHTMWIYSFRESLHTILEQMATVHTIHGEFYKHVNTPPLSNNLKMIDMDDVLSLSDYHDIVKIVNRNLAWGTTYGFNGYFQQTFPRPLTLKTLPDHLVKVWCSDALDLLALAALCTADPRQELPFLEQTYFPLLLPDDSECAQAISYLQTFLL
jgi:SAM-dependent methyltransferase